MSKRVKTLGSNELARRYSDTDSCCVVSVAGLDATSTNRLRHTLREQSIELRVVKNSLARRALADRPLGPLVARLAGPCAFATGGASVVEVAKELARLAREYPQLELKEGIIEGDEQLIPVSDIAKMRSRAETIGDLVGLIVSPARRLAGCLTGPGGRIAGCVKAIAEKADQNGDAVAA